MCSVLLSSWLWISSHRSITRTCFIYCGSCLSKFILAIATRPLSPVRVQYFKLGLGFVLCRLYVLLRLLFLALSSFSLSFLLSFDKGVTGASLGGSDFMFVFPPSTLTWLVNTLWSAKTWFDDTSNYSTHSKYEFKPLGSAHSPRGGRSVCFHIHECGIGSGWILYMHVYVACIISSSFKGPVPPSLVLFCVAFMFSFAFSFLLFLLSRSLSCSLLTKASQVQASEGLILCLFSLRRL